MSELATRRFPVKKECFQIQIIRFLWLTADILKKKTIEEAFAVQGLIRWVKKWRHNMRHFSREHVAVPYPYA